MKSKGDYRRPYINSTKMLESLVYYWLTLGEHTSKKVRKFCYQVGTTLKVLEEST